MNSSDIIRRLRTDSEAVIRELYRNYRDEFVQWAMKIYSCETSVALDAFQESIIILYENVQKGKLTELSSHIKTYIFAIAKRRLSKQYAKEVRMPEDGIKQTEEPFEASIEYKLEASGRVKQIAKLVAKLGPPCDNLLFLFYYRQFSMEAIASEMDYRNEDVAKSQKSRCMKKLKEKALKLNWS